MSSALNELIKNYHIFSSFDAGKGRETLAKINELRLAAAIRAEQRQVFWKETPIPASPANYTEDVFIASGDIRSVYSRFVAYLDQTATLALVQQGTREILFTRNAVPWQHLASGVQLPFTGNGQAFPFDLPQELFLDKNQSLNFAVTNQTNEGFIWSHGANLKDDLAPNAQELANEIRSLDEFGNPNLPQTVLVPLQFKFNSNVAGSRAVAVNGNTDIFSTKDSRSVLLTGISANCAYVKATLVDTGRNQLLCDEVNVAGISGYYTNKYSTFFPLPYPHLLRSQDRLQLKVVNGNDLDNNTEPADTIFTICFRGYTI